MFQAVIRLSGRLRRVIVPVAVLALGGMFASASPASPARRTLTTPSTRPAVARLCAPKQPVLLADDIIRQLRRLGLNFNKTRLSHPYDPPDWIC